MSVPYALKASDADTLGGLPALAFTRTATAKDAASVAPSVATKSTQASSGASAQMSSALQAHIETGQSVATVINGTANYLAMFSSATNLVNSAGSAKRQRSEYWWPQSLGALTLIGNVPFGDAAGMALYNIGAGAGASVSLDMYNTSVNGGIRHAKIKAVDDGKYSDHLTFGTKIPGSPGNPVTERMRITSTGRVGIGTTNPQQMLEVNGNAQVDGNLILSGNLLGPGSGGSVLKAPNDNSYNFAAGLAALSSTTSGTQNTAAGSNALSSNTTGSANTALGTGAIGTGALLYKTSGNYNVAVGFWRRWVPYLRLAEYLSGYLLPMRNQVSFALGRRPKDKRIYCRYFRRHHRNQQCNTGGDRLKWATGYCLLFTPL